MRGDGYFRNTAYLVVERALRLLLLLAVGAYVTRFLGPERFGQLSYVVNFVALLGAVSSLGIDGIVVRELVRRPQDTDSLLGTAFVIKLAGALGVAVVIGICSVLSNNDLQTTGFILIVAVGLLFQSFSVVDLHFQASVRSSRAAGARFVQILLSSSLRLLSIWTGQPLEVFVFLVFLDQLLLAIFYLCAYRLHVSSPLGWTWDVNFAKTLLAQARFILLADIVISVFYKIDQVMIKEMLGFTEVGLYSAATIFSEAWYFVAVAICASLYPMLIDAKREGVSQYHETLQRLLNLMVWLSLAIAIPLSVIAIPLMTLVYGPEYEQSGIVLRWHVWNALFVFLGIASGKWLLLEGNYRAVYQRASLGLIANVVLNFVWIPQYGIGGAAAASVVSQAMASIGYDFFRKDHKEVLLMKLRSLCLVDRKAIWRL